MEIENWLKKIGVGLAKYRWPHSIHMILKLASSQEGNNGINWFWMSLYKFRKAKSNFRKFWVIVVKSGWELLGCETLESAISQDWKAEMSWFFACCCKFRKAKFLDSRNFKVYARKKKEQYS